MGKGKKKGSGTRRATAEAKRMKRAQDLFVQMQCLPRKKRRKLSRDLMRQSDVRTAAKKQEMSFRTFRKKHSIPR